MELQIHTYEIEKNIDNNTLSQWDSNGTTPLGSWTGLEIKAFGGGNFGYLCSFNISDWTAQESYIEADVSGLSGSYKLYVHGTGAIYCYSVNNAGSLCFIMTIVSETGDFILQSVIVDLTGIASIRFSASSSNLENTYLDFISLLPTNFPNNLTRKSINISNILEIENLGREIEDNLFSFISDNISFKIYDDGDTDYAIIEDMVSSPKSFRVDIYYNNGISEYNFIYFTDTSQINKTIVNGKTIYDIQIFELSSFFKVNGWYLGYLINEIDDLGEVGSQEYNFYIEQQSTIEEIIDAGIEDAKKFMVSEYIPIVNITKSLTVYDVSINMSFAFIGRIIDYYLSSGRLFFIILSPEGGSYIYEALYSSVRLISSFGLPGVYIRFIDSKDDLLRYIVLGDGGSANISTQNVVFSTSSSTSVAVISINFSNGGEVIVQSLTVSAVSIGSLLTTASDSYENFFHPGSDDDNFATFNSNNENTILRFSNNITFNAGNYSFGLGTYTLTVEILTGTIVINRQLPCSLIFSDYITNGKNKTEVNSIISVIPDKISGYKLTNTTFLGMLKDLAITQNAFFYFNYSGNNMNLVFRTRGYQDAVSTYTIDLNKCSEYVETYDYIDYSEFETETFKNIISMKRSLLAYYRNFYGNGLKILKLTINDILPLSLGDIVTVEDTKYIIRVMEQEIGYKEESGVIKAPSFYLELMEVKYIS